MPPHTNNLPATTAPTAPLRRLSMGVLRLQRPPAEPRYSTEDTTLPPSNPPQAYIQSFSVAQTKLSRRSCMDGKLDHSRSRGSKPSTLLMTPLRPKPPQIQTRFSKTLPAAAVR